MEAKDLVKWFDIPVNPLQFSILVLLKSNEQDGICKITQREMAKRLGVRKETVHRHIKQLERKNIVEIQKQGKRNVYHIRDLYDKERKTHGKS